jgi:6,7-dimethyl-8-ribityllumazine synthase
MNPSDRPERDDDERAWEADDLERASENVLEGWPSAELEDLPGEPRRSGAVDAPPADEVDPGPAPPPELAPEPDDEPVEQPEREKPEGPQADAQDATGEHAPGLLAIPPGYPVLEGEARGARRAVGIVVSRFNGEVTAGLLESALGELGARGVEPDSITVMPVPGAFELPLGAMALAKTRRFACIVALGCVIRGDTPHFDYVASEAASGLQLAAIETGVPVSFGVLTLDRPDQAQPRLEKGAEAVRTALEMADLFANLRAAASR